MDDAAIYLRDETGLFVAERETRAAPACESIDAWRSGRADHSGGQLGAVDVRGDGPGLGIRPARGGRECGG